MHQPLNNYRFYKLFKSLTLIVICLIIVSTQCSAQNDDGKKVELQFEKRTSFYTVTDRYQLLEDTIYYADDGFRVFSGYDITTADDGKEYVILRYPNWTNNKQMPQKIEERQDKFLVDSLFLAKVKDLYKNDPVKSSIYKDIMDSLNNLLEAQLKTKPVHVDIVGRNGLKLAMPKTEFEKLADKGMIQDVYSLKPRHSTKLASGFMTIPFKLRPKQDSLNFNMTTDITLGAYVGVKKRISRRGNNYLVIPATLGLSYINVGNSETSNVNTEDNSSVVPGFTWSTGIVFDLNGFNVGFVLGQDYASGVGNDWVYNTKMWYSFSIGYSFFNGKEK